MTDRKRPEDEPSDEEVYVIDDTGDLQEVQDLAGYRETPVPVEESEEEPTLARPETSEGGESDELRRENAKLRDQLLRSRADFENFRKRAEREKSDFFRYALADTFRELLPVLDNFERALATGGEVPDEFRTGIEMIYKQLSDILSRSGLKVLEPKGELFDPAFHEAIAREETEEAEPNTVIDVLQKGYLLHERLIRPALVRVAAPRADA